VGVNINHKTSIARNLRKNMTEAEKRLWSKLRSCQIHGLKFRRQHPIGNYIVDFACLERKLVIELDGGQHMGDKQDKKRDQWLVNEGFKVIRYWNDQVLKETEAVVEDIMRNADSPSP
jgi:very-short-patch-repair endonuclease